MKRRRRVDKQTEQIMALDQVLEPYEEQSWQNVQDSSIFPDAGENQSQMDPAQTQYLYGEEYSEEHEAVDTENRFHFAIGMFDLISIIIGVAVILVLAGMLLTLLNWLRNDILHSALLLQSGLK